MMDKFDQAATALCDMIIAHQQAGGQINENVACTASAAAQLAQIATGDTDPVHNKETAVAAAVDCADVIESVSMFVKLDEDGENHRELKRRLRDGWKFSLIVPSYSDGDLDGFTYSLRKP